MAPSEFIKRPKLTLREHLLILGVFFVVTWILSGWYPAHMEELIIAAIIAYVLFWIRLEYHSTKGKIYQNAIAHFPTEIRGRETIVTRKPQISAAYKKVMGFKDYIMEVEVGFVAGSGDSGNIQGINSEEEFKVMKIIASDKISKILSALGYKLER